MANAMDLSALEQQIAAGFPLRDLCLTGGNYQGANLSGARFERVHARGACFAGANLDHTHWKDCQLEGADFSHSTGQAFTMEACFL